MSYRVMRNKDGLIVSARSNKLQAWLSPNGATYIYFNHTVFNRQKLESFVLSKNGEDFDGKDGFLLVLHSKSLWVKNLIQVVLESMESYFDYIDSDNDLERFLLEQNIIEFCKIDVFEYAIERKVHLADLWCVFAGLTMNIVGTFSDGYFESLIRARKPLVSYDKGSLNTNSPFSYFSPIFPNQSKEIDVAAPSDDSLISRVAQAVSIVVGESKSIYDAELNVDVSVVAGRAFTELEIRAVNNYALNVLRQFFSYEGIDENLMRIVKNLSKDKFVEFFGRFVEPHFGTKNAINLVFLQRVENNEVLADISHKRFLYRPDFYWALTNHEASIYDGIFYEDQSDVAKKIGALFHLKNSFNNVSYFYLQFIKHPEAFVSFSDSYVVSLGHYCELVEDSKVAVDFRFKAEPNLVDHLIGGAFNLKEIFEDFVESDLSIPFEILLVLKLDFSDKYSALMNRRNVRI